LKILQLLYHLVKPIIRLATLFFCRKIYLNTKKYLLTNGPLLLAVNHPNSFLDAVLIGIQFKQPVYFLARGDAFKKQWALKILTALKCIPVYRLREGKEFLSFNEATFEKCRAIFKQNGIVLIFSEGLCVNEWNIRNLKKGTARLAISSWQIPEIGNRLKILPVGINYSSFTRGPKKVFIQFGDYIEQASVSDLQTDGEMYSAINKSIAEQLQQLCWDGVADEPANNQLFSTLIANADQFAINEYATIQKLSSLVNMATEQVLLNPAIHHVSLTQQNRQNSFFTAILLLPFAAAAICTTYPIYLAMRALVQKKAANTGHYDSILFALCTLFFLLLQPFILILFFYITQNWNLAVSITMGLTLSTYFLTKFIVNWQRFWNYRKLSSEQRISLQRLLKTK
jgi:1-acyl-sn-glycerol-3-phosphate acyltransferase